MQDEKKWRCDKNTPLPLPRPPTPFLISLCSPSIQISHLSVASSQVGLVEDKSTNVSIQNASVIFKGTLGCLEISIPIQLTCLSLALSGLRAERGSWAVASLQVEG